MVSRSLEKMLLIALGLSTAVIVGIPILMIAIQTLQGSSDVEAARIFADNIHSLVRRVDNGVINDTTAEIFIPDCIAMEAQGTNLVVHCHQNGKLIATWERSYNHEIETLESWQGEGSYLVQVWLENEIIKITFSSL